MVLAFGCGVEPGSKYDVYSGFAQCYAGEEDFRDYLEKKRAGLRDEDWLMKSVDGRMVGLNGSDRVTIIKAVADGAKVHVDTGEHRGFVGYMDTNDLRASSP